MGMKLVQSSVFAIQYRLTQRKGGRRGGRLRPGGGGEKGAPGRCLNLTGIISASKSNPTIEKGRGGSENLPERSVSIWIKKEKRDRGPNDVRDWGTFSAGGKAEGLS